MPPDGRLHPVRTCTSPRRTTAVHCDPVPCTAIYVSQSDPDCYFSLKPIVHAFPGVKILAATETLQAIKASVEKKLAVRGPQLKENGPQSMADIVLPEAFDGPSLSVDGVAVEIVAAEGLVNRRYLWVPSLNAVFGGVLIFAGVHVWTADTATAELRAVWVANLDKIAALKAAMEARFPGLGMGVAPDIGAKVANGEMKWG
jgi:hypothetical protein